MPSTLGYKLSDGGRSALLLAEETENIVRGRNNNNNNSVTSRGDMHLLQRTPR